MSAGPARAAWQAWKAQTRAVPSPEASGASYGHSRLQHSPAVDLQPDSLFVHHKLLPPLNSHCALVHGSHMGSPQQALSSRRAAGCQVPHLSFTLAEHAGRQAQSCMRPVGLGALLQQAGQGLGLEPHLLQQPWGVWGSERSGRVSWI